MDSESEEFLKTFIAVTLFVAWTVVISIIFYIAGCNDQTKRAQKEAVLKGAAEYVVDESGNPVFQWKENK